MIELILRVFELKIVFLSYLVLSISIRLELIVPTMTRIKQKSECQAGLVDIAVCLQLHFTERCSRAVLLLLNFKLDGDLADTKPPPSLPSMDFLQTSPPPSPTLPFLSILPPSLSPSHFQHTTCGRGDSWPRWVCTTCTLHTL